MRRKYRTHLGPKFSEGARLLWEAIDTTTAREAERALNWAPGMLFNVLYGERGVGRKTGALLLERYGIPLDAWDKAPTVPFVPPAARVDGDEDGVA